MWSSELHQQTKINRKMSTNRHTKKRQKLVVLSELQQRKGCRNLYIISLADHHIYTAQTIDEHTKHAKTPNTARKKKKTATGEHLYKSRNSHNRNTKSRIILSTLVPTCSGFRRNSVLCRYADLCSSPYTNCVRRFTLICRPASVPFRKFTTAVDSQQFQLMVDLRSSIYPISKDCVCYVHRYIVLRRSY